MTFVVMTSKMGFGLKHLNQKADTINEDIKTTWMNPPCRRGHRKIGINPWMSGVNTVACFSGVRDFKDFKDRISIP